MRTAAWLCLLATLGCGTRPLEGTRQGKVGPGSTVTHDIAWGDEHIWEVQVERGQAVELRIEQDGVDVEAAIWGRRKRVCLVDFVARTRGPDASERIWWIADKRSYRLRLLPATLPTRDARYSISVEAREPTDLDRQHILLLDLIQEAREASDAAGDELPTAVATWKRVVELASEIDDDALEGYGLLQWGRAAGLANQGELSRELRQRALDFYRKRNDEAGIAAAQFEFANALIDNAKYADALETLDEAVELARRVGDANVEAKSLHNRGYMHSLFDEHQLAISDYRAALSAFARTRNYSQAVSLMALANEYHRLGDPETALELYEQAYEFLHENHRLWDSGRALAYIGLAHLDVGELSESLEAFEEALRQSKEAGDTRNVADVSLMLGTLHSARGDTTRACAAFDDALEQWRQLSDALKIIEAQIHHARCLDHEAAVEEVNRARVRAHELGMRDLESRALHTLAQIAYDEQDYDKAREHITAATRLAEDIRSQIHQPDQRAGFFGTIRDLYDTWTDIEVARGDSDAAFAVTERARARTFLESLSESRTRMTRAARPEDLSLLNRTERALKEAQLAYVRALAGSDVDAITQARERVDRALEAHTDTVGYVRALNPRYAELTQIPDVDLRTVQRTLGRGEALVEFALGEQRSHVWTIRHTSIQHAVLPASSEIDTQVRSFYEALTARNEVIAGESPAARARRIQEADASVRARGRALAQVLGAFDTLAADNAIQRVMVIPDGSLHYVPFAALTTTGRNDDAQFLIERFELATLPSAAVRFTLGKRQPAKGKNVLVLADPVYPEGSRFARLRFTQAEADAIADLAPERVTVRNRYAASREAVLEAQTSDYRVIHFATHGTLDNRTPQLSSVVLSLENEDGHTVDGFLRLHQIYDLDLDTEVVVLSACETALGKNIRGEGVVGLTRGFLYAGSRSVVGSLWQVQDRATADLMTDFYDNLLTRGRPTPTALREAQQSLLDSERFGEPYYWAAFTYQGR